MRRTVSCRRSIDNVMASNPRLSPTTLSGGLPPVLDVGVATFRVLRSERTSMMYMVSENEMRSLANYNHLVAAFLSLAFSLIAFAGGLAIQAAQQSHANHQAWVLVEIVGAVCGLLAVVLFIGAVFVALARRDEIQRIKGETRTLEG